MPSQRPDEDAPTMLPTKSLGWNGLQVLKFQLSGRLTGFAPDRRSSDRPRGLDNDAAFFEDDLRYILTAKSVVVQLSEERYKDMDNIALSLLDELNGIVNGDLIELQEVQDHQKSESLEHSSPKLHDITNLTGRHKRLSAMLYFLQARPGDRFSLATGPDPPLFTFPPGGYGMKAMGYAKIWRAFLDRLAAEATISQGLQSISLQAMGLSGEELTDDQSDMLERRASVVIDAMFKEFRQLNCADVRTHEIRLRLSGLYTDPAQPILDVFVSSCPNETSENWHEARCGSFPVAIDGAGKQNLCAVIDQAIDESRKLHLLVNQQGLFNVTDKMPKISSSSANFKSETLIKLFHQDLFSQITIEDSRRGIMEKKVGSKQKAEIALMLARCLLDFFDDDIELASHSWAPEQIFFISPSTTTLATRGNIYVSLKPRPREIKPTDLLGEFRAGNPILLSFARLLLEIETGKEIRIPIHPETKKNEENWGILCRFVKEKKDKGDSVEYLDAVEGCLHLCNNLPRSKDRPTGSAASKVLRKAIYEKIILKLELITNPQSSKRKRQFSVSEHPQAKKPLIAGLLGGESPGAHSSTTPFYHKQGEQSTTPEQPTHQRAGRFDGRLCESLKASTDLAQPRTFEDLNRTWDSRFEFQESDDAVKIAILDTGVNLFYEDFQNTRAIAFHKGRPMFAKREALNSPHRLLEWLV